MLHISQKQAFANRRIHRSLGDVCFDLINVLLLTVFTLICVFPFYYLFINTISDNALSARGLITLFPRESILKTIFRFSKYRVFSPLP